MLGQQGKLVMQSILIKSVKKLPVSVAWRAWIFIFHRACTALSRRKYCIEKEEKSDHKQSPLFFNQFSTALARTAFFSPRCRHARLRRATEAGINKGVRRIRRILRLFRIIWGFSRDFQKIFTPVFLWYLSWLMVSLIECQVHAYFS